jgi:hypothetical protein
VAGPRYRNNVFQHVLRGGPAGGDVFQALASRAVGHNGGFPGISADFRMCLDAGYTMAVPSNYGGGTDPVSQKVQNLVGRKG